MLSLENLRKGTLISTIAAVLILILLVELQAYGLRFTFTTLAKVQMTIIWLLALPATYFYSRSNLNMRNLFRVSSALAVLITLIGLVLLFLNDFLGVELIVLGYIFEPIAGMSIFFSLTRSIYNYMFIAGAWAYTLGLPLYLYDFGYVSIIGDLVKLIGLVFVSKSLMS